MKKKIIVFAILIITPLIVVLSNNTTINIKNPPLNQGRVCFNFQDKRYNSQ